MKNGLILLGMIVALALVPPACADAIIIDHNCTNLSEIPDEWIDATQDHIKLHYAHTSHGGQLTTGLQRIENADSNCSQAKGSSYLPTEADALCIFDGQEHDTHITPEEYWDSEAGRQYTQDVIDHNPTINVSMWSWCCQLTSYSAEQVQTYLDVMEGFETSNPDVRFAYMTCNAQATGGSGYNRHLRNEQIRSWVRDHPEDDRVLFDFADLDSWWYNSTAGAWEHATYEYSGTEVPVEHSQFHGGQAGHTTYESCEQKGRAVWHIMARLAGWDGGHGDGTIYANTSGWWIDPAQFNASGTPIQSAIDNATESNRIYVYNGSYTENVLVNKRLTLEGEGRDVVTVQANDSGLHVFTVTADYVNITGFTATGATGNGKAGIYLDHVDHCNISDNNISENYNGIYLSSSSSNTLQKNLAVDNDNEGVCLWYSSDNSITNNVVNSNTQSNIWMRYSDNNTLTENIVKMSLKGICIYDSSNNSITDNSANSNNCGIYLYNSVNNRLINNTASENYDGIYLNWGNHNNMVANNTLVNNTNGIEVRVSCNNTLANNNASRNKECGIYLWASSNNNTIVNNTANSNRRHMGIYLFESDNNRLIRNTANYNDWEGIRLYYSDNCLIEGNDLFYNFNLTEDTGTGVLSWTSGNTTITNNTAGHNMCGIYLYIASSNNTVINNTASENDVHGIVVYMSSDAMICNNTASHNMYHGFAGCDLSNLTVTENTLIDNGVGDDFGYGIYLREGAGAIVSDNQIADNAALSYACGIKLYSFTNVTVHNNTIVNNSDYGILIDSSTARFMGVDVISVGGDGTTAPPTTLALLDGYGEGMLESGRLLDMDIPGGINITENNVRGNTGGVCLSASSGVVVAGNTVTDNDIGINLTSSGNNMIYNNYFDNTNNAYDGGTNIWNTTKATGPNIIGGPEIDGNYWSDYTGTDTNGDGFGDAPHNITGGSNYDHLPLVPWCGNLDGNMTVDAADLQLLLNHIFAGTQVTRECAGDVDGSGDINIMDARLLLNHIADRDAYPLNCSC